MQFNFMAHSFQTGLLTFVLISDEENNQILKSRYLKKTGTMKNVSETWF